jgi:hypothetical protein
MSHRDPRNIMLRSLAASIEATLPLMKMRIFLPGTRVKNWRSGGPMEGAF